MDHTGFALCLPNSNSAEPKQADGVSKLHEAVTKKQADNWDFIRY